MSVRWGINPKRLVTVDLDGIPGRSADLDGLCYDILNFLTKEPGRQRQSLHHFDSVDEDTVERQARPMSRIQLHVGLCRAGALGLKLSWIDVKPIGIT